MDLSLFELAAGVLGAAALAGWINVRFVGLPVASGLLVLGLVASLGAAVLERVWPQAGVGRLFAALDRRIDYPALVLNFLLAYLLFAGAMNVRLAALKRRAWATAALAVAGTVATAVLVGVGIWALAGLVGRPLPLAWALVFGVLISPTDPIAVLAMTKRTALDEDLRAQLEGEALFNDGVAVVLFRAALAFATAGAAGAQPQAGPLLSHIAVEALGGGLIGLVGGGVAVAVIKAVDDWATETLVTVAVATAVYALALRLELSGPIGVVVAGLIVGSGWSRRWMSEPTRLHIFPFWRVVDEGLNAVLFLGLGLKAWQVWTVDRFGTPALALALAAPLLVLAARWVVIALPASALPLFGRRISVRLVNVLTWAGVRGGLSMAMALSIPDGPHRPLILAATLAVVTVSILVQSLSMERLAIRTGYGRPREIPEAI